MNVDSLPPYFQERIRLAGSCWEWTGPRNQQGYGVANLPGGAREGAHRAVYLRLVGPIEDETLDHMCHDPESCSGGPSDPHRRCVNPAHLEPAGRVENAMRSRNVGAVNLAKECCPRCGGVYTTSPRGWRYCVPCLDKWREANRGYKPGRPPGRPWTTTCSGGHTWEDETTRWSKGKRYCKLCDQERRARAKVQP